MKKTLIALMALAGIMQAEARPTTMWNPEDFGFVAYQTSEDLSLTTTTTITASEFDFPYGNINTVDGLIISRDFYNNESHTSPGFAKIVLTLNLTNLEGTGSVFYVKTDNTHHDINNNGGNDAWGITLGENGALDFGRIHCSAASSIANNKVSLGTVAANTSYTITIVSTGINESGIIGRGSENFKISVDDGTTVTNYTGAGFGLNGNQFHSINVGSAVNGTLGMTVYIPEPATATLSLLALAGLAARRRRK